MAYPIFVSCFILACCVGTAPAAAMHWQPAPKESGMHQNRMAAKEFMLTNADGAEADFWPLYSPLSMY